MPFRLLSLCVLSCITILILSGCGQQAGPDLATVTGTVTFDGKPVPNARVEFSPSEGRPSVGTTNAEGVYDLQFSIEKPGAMVGAHNVKITTERAATGGEGNEPLVPGSKELLPAAYHSNSHLTANVTPGENVIDFPLTSNPN
ncbi:MAG: carboxypeptidase regulatory-like domain-containing protein [Gimesia chilikensis]|uniref:carboxypeptidase regulatory-like domain-containing protein n=1 Tax=Gimesia chilikensis TaxID=2605989 RepID=UPI0037A33341